LKAGPRESRDISPTSEEGRTVIELGFGRSMI
jgi:hypothetical protein